MNQLLRLPTTKVKISPLGLQASSKLTGDEWAAMAPLLGNAARALAFIIGDWLVYGDDLFGVDSPPNRHISAALYEKAATDTGLDIPTLQIYAFVSRRVPHRLRSERLSWEHHKVLAKMSETEQAEWIQTCHAEEDSGRRMTLRRLRKSILLGRIATPSDLEPDESDKGVENHIPFVNRLSLWWRHMQEDRFLVSATYEQRQALKRDLEPVVNIYNQL